MARQPRTGATTPERKKEDEQVETLSNAPVENIPEESGGVTGAAAKAAPKDPVMKAPAKAVAEASAAEEPTVQYARVMADKRIQGSSGFRSVMRAGKEISSTQYNFKKLRAQGVQLQEISKEDLTTF